MEVENTAPVAGQEAPNAASEAAVSSQEPVSRDFDAEAREMGWVPETEFKGDKARWKPAQQFVEDGEKILPIVRSQLKREKEERERERTEFQKRLERMERMSNVSIERLKAQHKADIDRVQAAKLQAVEAGDTDEYKRLDKVEKDLSKQTFEEPAEDPQAKYQANVDGFKKANDWYEKDADMTAFANGVSQSLAAANPNITFEENARLTVERVKAAFPHKFSTKSAANGHAAVDGGGDFPGAGRTPQGKTFNDLPAEAKAACKRFVDQGVMTKEQYVKDYFND